MRRSRSDQLELPLRFRHQQAVGRAHLALEGRLIAYTIKRSTSRRAISILIDEDGLRVSAPWSTSQSAIERLLQKHTDWVIRKLDQWQAKRTPVRDWNDGTRLMYLGQPLRLKLACESQSVQLSGDELVLGRPAGEVTVAIHVHQWLHERALALFGDRVEHFRRTLGIASAPRVLLSSARTRWGSCHISGRIHLNWRLIQMPMRLIDYVAAHEVAHLIEMNHSQRFWQAVGQVVPDYRARRKELRRDGPHYLLL